jgi:hypothetical protein
VFLSVDDEKQEGEAEKGKSYESDRVEEREQTQAQNQHQQQANDNFEGSSRFQTELACSANPISPHLARAAMPAF